MRYRFQNGDQVYEISMERKGAIFHAEMDGQSYEVEVLDQQPGLLSLRFAGRPVTLYWAADGSQKWISINGCTYRLDRPTGSRQARHSGDSSAGESVRAPMPAQVRAVQVLEGDTVEKGQTLLLLEAMKMEIRVKAPAAGKVARVLVKPGQSVEKEQVLVQMGE
jgi:biotin carboxyl carrier protein